MVLKLFSGKPLFTYPLPHNFYPSLTKMGEDTKERGLIFKNFPLVGFVPHSLRTTDFKNCTFQEKRERQHKGIALSLVFFNLDEG